MSESGIERSRQPEDAEHQSPNPAGGSSTDQQTTATTPEQTIRKMEAIKRAATAPAKPSSADRSIAAAAAATESLARQELHSAQAEAAPTGKESESDDLVADKKPIGRDAAANDAAFPTPLDIVA